MYRSFLLVFLIFFLTGNTFAAKKLALIIGNGDYKKSPLSNPVNDANDMSNALQKLNFKVIKRINADKKSMRIAIREFGDELLKTQSVGLFFYAGHGIQVNGQNYLVPINSEIEREDEVADECLKASSVLRKMESAKNSLNIIILDACRDNPFKGSFRSGNRGLAEMQPPTGSIIAYATGPGSVAADGNGRNGLYTSKLLKHINTPGLTIERIFKKVRVDVLNESKKKQVPWDLSSLTGDFYFQKSRAIKVVTLIIPKVKKPKIVKPEIDKPKAVESVIIKGSKPDFLLTGRIDNFKNNALYLELKLISTERMNKIWVGQRKVKIKNNKKKRLKFVIKQLLKDAINEALIYRNQKRYNKPPFISVGKINNRSNKKIDGEKLKEFLEEQLSSSERVANFKSKFNIRNPQMPNPPRRPPPPRKRPSRRN